MSVLVCLSLLDGAKVRIVCEHTKGFCHFCKKYAFFLMYIKKVRC